MDNLLSKADSIAKSCEEINAMILEARTRLLNIELVAMAERLTLIDASLSDALNHYGSDDPEAVKKAEAALDQLQQMIANKIDNHDK
jgi:hypothetical protein